MMRSFSAFSERRGFARDEAVGKAAAARLTGVCGAVSRPPKLHGQFYLLIGRHLLQTEYTAGALITEVRRDLSAATGKRSAPFTVAGTLTTTECVLLGRVMVLH